MLTITCAIASAERCLSKLILLTYACEITAEKNVRMQLFRWFGDVASRWELRESKIRALADQTCDWSSTVHTNKAVLEIRGALEWHFDGILRRLFLWLACAPFVVRNSP